jgi:hypothetical protein
MHSINWDAYHNGSKLLMHAGHHQIKHLPKMLSSMIFQYLMNDFNMSESDPSPQVQGIY